MAGTPKVGDAAVLDGQHLTVIEVTPERVKFGDADSVQCTRRVAEIREAAKPEGDALAERWTVCKAEVARIAQMPTATPQEQEARRRAESASNAVRAKLALEEDIYRTTLAEALDAVPRGTRIGINPADVVYVETDRMVVGHGKGGFVFEDVSGVWSVPGRLSPDSVPGANERPVKVPKIWRRQDELTIAHRAAKAAKEG